jgi:hypothetical protein
MQSPPSQIPIYSIDDAFATDQQLVMPCADEWSTDVVECSTTNSLSQATSIDTFYGHESTSFISVGVLLDPVSSETSQTRFTG